MMRRLLLVVALVGGVSLVLLAATVMGGPAAVAQADTLPDEEFNLPQVYWIRFDGLTKAPPYSAISSRYVITNLASNPATTQHELYNELGVPYTWQTVYLGANEAKTYDLADAPVSPGQYYVIVLADQPITGTVLIAPPEHTWGTVFLPLVIKSPPAPPPPPPPLGDGFYLVGAEIRPGKWHSTGTGTSCYWARYDAYQGINDNHFGLAGGTVNVRASDYEIEFRRCGMWEYVEDQPKVLEPGAADPKGDGFYTVGVEIMVGRWDSTGTGDSCYWARYDSYQGILDNHFGMAGGTVLIRETDYEVEFNRCGTWVYLGL